MKRIQIVAIIISVITVCSGCAKSNTQNIAVKINDYWMTADEFKEKFKFANYYTGIEDKEEFLQDWINRQLMLREAERQGWDKKSVFIKEIEQFWEKTLLKYVIEQKSKELVDSISVDEGEIQTRYQQMNSQGLISGSYDANNESLKWQILREKQITAFQAWIDALRSQSAIEINLELIE